MTTRLRFAIVLAVVTAMSSCTEQKEVAGPCLDCPFVVIQGTVRGIDGPLPAQIVSEHLGDDDRVRDRITVRTDATGAYRLLVPPGRQLLSVWEGPDPRPNQMFVWTEHGLSLDESPDTLTFALEDGARTMDFSFGGLRVDVSAPQESTGTRIAASIYLSESGRGRSVEARIEAGRAQIEFANVPVGEYRLQVGVARAGYWHPGVQNREQAALLHVPPFERAVLETSVPERGHLRGRVTGSWQVMDPYERPEVSLVSSTDSTDVLARELVAPDGAFDLAVLAAFSGRVRITIDRRDRWIGGSHFSDATTFDLAPGRVVEHADFAESGLRVSFELPKPGDSDYILIEYTLVDASKRLLFKAHDVFPVTSRLEIPNLRAGIYYFYAKPTKFGANAWVSEWFDGSQWLATATPITIPSEGAVVDVVMRPALGGTLTGRVLRASGFPVRYSKLIAIDMSDPRREILAFPRTDDTGHFVLRGLRTGPWKIGLLSELGVRYWYPGTYDVDQAMPVSVVAGEEVPAIEWRAP